MFQLNDILICKSLNNEKVRLTSIDYNPFTKKMIYIVESKELDRYETDFFDLKDIRYCR